jgi:hypothetical protein
MGFTTTSVSQNPVKTTYEYASFQTFVWTTLLETVNLKPLIVALMLMLGQQLSGVNAVIFFSVTIFNAAKTSLPSLLENVIVGGKWEYS